MKYAFSAQGHPNLMATHRTTLEITKDSELTKKGDCIVAVKADFSLQRIKDVIHSCSNNKIIMTIAAAGLREEIIAVANNAFNSDSEIVLRKGDFASERTLGTRADKAAAEIDSRIVSLLKGEKAVIITVAGD